MKYIISYLSAFLIIIAVSACSDISDEITTPQEVNVHESGVLNSSSNGFHGRLLINGFEDCQQCHASDLSGGTAGVGCQNCHNSINVHKEGIINVDSDNFHGKYLRGTWNLNSCSKCHGESYTGGVTSPTCASSGCHTSQDGPEACNTCHGDFNDPSKIAPPNDIEGNSATSSPGVGAHSQHLHDTMMSNEIACQECHIVPQNTYEDEHFDIRLVAIDKKSDELDQAEVVFGTLATLHDSDPEYNFENQTCSNTYCHGNFEFLRSESESQFAYVADKMEGNNFSPVWNQVDGTQAECGTCHNLPPIGHVPSDITACATCHPGIVDNEGNIIDKTKHINGEANVFGN